MKNLELRENYRQVGTVNYEDIITDGDGAQPTSRVLDGSSDHGYAQEWVECGTYQGRQVKVVYLFDDDDIRDADGNEIEEAENYPWDACMSRVEYTD